MAVETVSLCVVALNESKFLPNLLRDLHAQTYPHAETEIVLVDSGSSDGTKSIMERFARDHRQEYLGIQVLDNTGGIQASGWNVAIRHFTGDVIIRIDAHTHIPAEFAEKNMRNLQGGEYVSGGIRPCVIENDSAWARTLLETENSLFGSSVNTSRRSRQKQYVKSLFHGAYRREVFEKSGVFSEQLLRTEDNEMHYRIRQNGYRICYDPDIVSYQYARSSLRRMIRQKYGNGYWIGLTLGVCPGCISLFHLVPLVFVAAIAGTSVLAACGWPLLSVLMWSAYALFTLMGVGCSVLNGKATVFTPLMPLLFLLLHVSYGVGTLVGLVKMPAWRKTYQAPGPGLGKEE